MSRMFLLKGGGKEGSVKGGLTAQRVKKGPGFLLGARKRNK